MKKTLLIILMTICLSTNVYASDLSNWAEESFNNMSSYGVLINDIVNKNMNEDITREEFSSLVMNIYKTEKRIVLTDADKNVFDDTDNTSILEAYKVGIVSGKGDRTFEPNSPITRQEMAVILSRTLNIITYDYNKYDGQKTSYLETFSDAELTAEWALDDMAAICDYNIITGNDLNEAQPLDRATREQAICMLDRVYSKFITNSSQHNLPKFKSLDKKSVIEGNVIASWQREVGATRYTIIIKPQDCEAVLITLPQTTTSINEFYEALAGFESYTVFLGVTKSNNTQVFSKPITITKKSAQQAPIEPEEVPEITEPENTIEEDTEFEEEFEDEQFDESLIHSTESFALYEKEKRVFPDGLYFETEEIAKEHIIEVEVPVWRLHSDGTKTSSVAYIEVNLALAQDVIDIFTEIYNDDSQFPIKSVGGYCWRNTAGGKISQHSYGTCIDINWEENYYVNPDGTPITGSHWLPDEDPYSIAEDSIVVKTFAKYGWLWGGNAWGPSYAKDYMHFTYLGK